jgi:hypothetical protein
MNNDTIIPSTTTYHVGHWPVQLIGYGCAPVFGAFAVLAISTQQAFAALLFLPWIVLGLYLGLRTGTTTITPSVILHCCPLGRYQIAWDAVTKIENDRQGNCWIFHGHEQRLVVPGRVFWTGQQKRLAQQAVDDYIQDRGIPVRESLSAPYKISRNTRQ